MKVYVISGNHDFRQERPDDPDLLEVMMQSLPPLQNECHYLRDTGFYEVDASLSFGVVAVRETLNSFDTSGLVTELPVFPGSVAERCGRNVALFHGTITQSSLPNGQRMTAGKGYPLEWFPSDVYDMVLLGDNHLQQWHPSKNGLPAWGYPGSLIQQDFGEPLHGHGFLVWNMETCEAQPIHVPNDYGRIRAKIDSGVTLVRMAPSQSYVPIATIVGSLPLYPHVSVVGNVGDDKIVMTSLKEHGINPINVSTILSIQQYGDGTSMDCVEAACRARDLAAVHNPSKWIEYIGRTDPDLARQLSALEWCEHPEKITFDIGSDIAIAPQELHEQIQERCERITQAIQLYRSLQERVNKPKNVNMLYLEWAWAFAYGENNWVNFQTMEGEIALLNGKNATGKSSFIDIICIALFGEPGKNRNINVTKRMTSLMIHHQKPARVPMYCTIVFEVDGERYMIERVYTPHKTKTDEYGIQMSKCELYQVSSSISSISTLVCSGATLVDGWVREHCGTIEDMMESTVVSQMDIHNFFMLKPDQQKERIDESLNLDCIRLYGNILKQAVLAFNAWIESLGTYLRVQKDVGQQLYLGTERSSCEIDLDAMRKTAAELENHLCS
jgi:energy-coupling factor transporter ATP-binding protein EcfA2